MPAPGTKLGPYEVVGPLGAGGMGEVFRARDPRLARDVAIKALPAAFAQDAERLARFEREAKLLASLNHPNVAGIHGVEEADGTRYLVLEFVDGETLDAHLQRGRLPLAEVLDIARQVAAGVEAAHEAGVVHRDLKPGNVMLTASGGVKVLDFGLAKSGARTSASSSDPKLSASPTMTYHATEAGMILGTAAYMSPEQARGKAVDRRTDIWSFGCVLYEMLAGKRAYDGETVSDMVARILEREPDWSALPAAVPPRLVALLKRCLTKDAKQRVRDIGDVRLELEAIAAGDGGAATAIGASRAGGAPVWLAPALALAGVALGLALGVALFRERADRGAATLTLLSPPGVSFGRETTDLAVSPDGRSLVYVGSDTLTAPRLWVRSLERENSRPLVGTEHAAQPFWSPDGRSIGFFADDKLKSCDLATGAVRTLASAPLPRGGAWGRGVILYQPVSIGPLWSVPEAGGTPSIATQVDSARGDHGHRFPQFLPDGRHFVMVAIGRGPNRIVGSELGSSTVRELYATENDCGVTVASGEWLLSERDGMMKAQRVDPRTLALRGTPVEVPGLRAVPPAANGAPEASGSPAGVVVQRAASDLPQRLSLVDRQGRTIVDVSPPDATYMRGSLSPDGRHAVVEYSTGSSYPNLWIVDFERALAQPFMQGDDNFTPVYSPDGRTIAVGRIVNGSGQDLYLVDSDRPGSLRRVHRMTSRFLTNLSWTPDGRGVLMRSQGTTTRQDLIWVSVVDSSDVRVLRGTAFNEPAGAVSPDGRWLAYVSDESGQQELRVVSFEHPDGPTTLVSRGAYADPSALTRLGLPVWRRDGRELLYMAADQRTLLVVSVTPGAPPVFGEPQPLFRLSGAVADIAVSPGLDRFMLAITRDEEGRSLATVLLDWTKLLGARK